MRDSLIWIGNLSPYFVRHQPQRYRSSEHSDFGTGIRARIAAVQKDGEKAEGKPLAWYEDEDLVLSEVKQNGYELLSVHERYRDN